MIDGFPENECEFIGLIMQEPQSVHAQRARVGLEAFTNHVTRAIWEGMCKLAAAGTEVSIPALRETVKVDVVSAGIPSVPSFLMACMQQTKGDLSLDDLADIICEKARKVKLNDFAGELVKKLHDGREGTEQIALEASEFLANLAASSRPAVGVSLHDAGKEALVHIREARSSGQPRGHDWGLRTLDDLMGRICVGDFGMIIGPSGHAKSSLLRGVASHIAKREPVLTITAEETPIDIAVKDLAARTDVSGANIEANRLTATDLELLENANIDQHGLRSFFEYTDDMRISNIEKLIRAFAHAQGGCGAVFIDTVDDIDPEEPRLGMTERVISSCRKLDKLSTKLRVAIIGIGQVKTVYNERPDTSLKLSDSYGGQAVRNKASWVLLMHRPQKKLADVLIPGAGNNELERQKWLTLYDKWKDQGQFTCSKRRRGPDGKSVRLGWSGPATRFYDLDDGGVMEDLF